MLSFFVHTLILTQAILWSLTILAFMFTVGRFAIHWNHRRKVKWDDILNGVAAAFLLAFAGTYQVFGPTEYDLQLYGLGLLDERPAFDERTLRKARKYSAAGNHIFWCVIYSVKASFLALYWLLFNVSTRFRIAWAFAVVYVVIAFGISLMWDFWHCGKPKWYLTGEHMHPFTTIFMSTNIPDRCPRTAPYFNAMLITWCILDFVGDLLSKLLISLHRGYAKHN